MSDYHTVRESRQRNAARSNPSLLSRNILTHAGEIEEDSLFNKRKRGSSRGGQQTSMNTYVGGGDQPTQSKGVPDKITQQTGGNPIQQGPYATTSDPAIPQRVDPRSSTSNILTPSPSVIVPAPRKSGYNKVRFTD